MNDLDKKIASLPPELRWRVEVFVESLLQDRKKLSNARPAFKWAGALRDLRDEYSSTQLQHAIMGWRMHEQ